eukprot:CAMPEP_0172484482 /NCGR_PEP_ID=MMETSP1066-20121228/11975_1 /TAXON_ID=671091 /ORGANISM="Coscinodiscus wailesii, Strain CCMP2513" /LENGTH=496 /DNA_ID=CAMNT_0013249059 /DNA_START=97 /DNA_END=1587 /DNA_ORIENTATION=-
MTFLVSTQGLKNVIIESFGDEPKHAWFGLNDPVMGGMSTGTATVTGGIGVFEGEVMDVPRLDAPGFIAMMTRGGWFPDVSSCTGLKMTLKSLVDYGGYHVSFGNNHPAGAMPYARGYKTKFDAPVGAFGDVYLPFMSFSDYWSPYTGDQVVKCSEDNQYCPDESTLKNLMRFEIMAEGVAGKVSLEIKSIEATECSDDVVEEDPDPESHQNDFAGPNNYRSGNTNTNEKNYVAPVIDENGDIRIESFADPQHTWVAVNDPVMGGSSSSTVLVMNDKATFEGEVVNVERLNAPGFIKMETRGGAFPDVSHCKALKINLMSLDDYDGLRVSFGVHHAEGAAPYIRGYKAHITAPQGLFDDIIIPFTDFSDSWNPMTGDVMVSCIESPYHCPDSGTLRDFTTFSIMGEGVNGKVHLEVHSIDATDCNMDDNQLTNSANRTASNTQLSYVHPAVWIAISISCLVSVVVSFYIGKRRGISISKPQEQGGIVLAPVNKVTIS